MPSSILPLRGLSGISSFFHGVLLGVVSLPSSAGGCLQGLQMLKFELEIRQTAAADTRQKMGISGTHRERVASTKLLFVTPAPVDMVLLRSSPMSDKELEYNLDLFPHLALAFFPVPTAGMAFSFSWEQVQVPWPDIGEVPHPQPCLPFLSLICPSAFTGAFSWSQSLNDLGLCLCL